VVPEPAGCVLKRQDRNKPGAPECALSAALAAAPFARDRWFRRLAVQRQPALRMGCSQFVDLLCEIKIFLGDAAFTVRGK
jgi:hypothetical protein